MLADTATEIYGSRTMLYDDAWKADQGRNVIKETSMVKLNATGAPGILFRIWDAETEAMSLRLARRTQTSCSEHPKRKAGSMARHQSGKERST